MLYGFPARSLTVVGVTGTNGKTTTVHMIGRILEEAGFKVAMASTIAYRIAEKESVNKTKFTTASAFAVQRFLRRARRAGCSHVVLEVSSHALDQSRLWGVPFEVAVITNVTREHLDYHHTMDEYRKAKKKLFEKTKHGVVNSGMKNPQEFAEVVFGRCILYGTYDPGYAEYETILAKRVHVGESGTTFFVRQVPFIIRLSGVVNVENALAAVAASRILGVKLPTMSSALRKMTLVPGRMERIPNDRGISIYIDYAVTPDALEKLYVSISEKKPGKIIAVFGSCGERDRGKRPIMGEIVDTYADVIILTNEDPYHEDPVQIVSEVAAGVKRKKLGEDFFKIMDRREAIKKALDMAQKGDTVVITGKGAEETMMIGGKMIPWNDRRVVEEELRN